MQQLGEGLSADDVELSNAVGVALRRTHERSVSTFPGGEGGVFGVRSGHSRTRPVSI